MEKNICDLNKLIHQLNKLDENTLEKKDIFPISLIQSIFDAKSGIRLDSILSCFNFLFVPYAGSKEATRLQIPLISRRRSLIISYRDFDDSIVLEQYEGISKADEEWVKNRNWQEPFKNGNYNVNIDIEEINRLVNEYLTSLDGQNLIKNNIINTTNNYINSEDFINSVNSIVIETCNNLINNYLQTDDITNNINNRVSELINQYINSQEFDTAIQNKLTDIVNNYFNSEEFNQLATTIINNKTQPVVNTLISDVRNIIETNERVIANALTRHEEDILNLKS